MNTPSAFKSNSKMHNLLSFVIGHVNINGSTFSSESGAGVHGLGYVYISFFFFYSSLTCDSFAVQWCHGIRPI